MVVRDGEVGDTGKKKTQENICDEANVLCPDVMLSTREPALKCIRLCHFKEYIL